MQRMRNEPKTDAPAIGRAGVIERYCRFACFAIEKEYRQGLDELGRPHGNPMGAAWRLGKAANTLNRHGHLDELLRFEPLVERCFSDEAVEKLEARKELQVRLVLGGCFGHYAQAYDAAQALAQSYLQTREEGPALRYATIALMLGRQMLVDDFLEVDTGKDEAMLRQALGAFSFREGRPEENEKIARRHVERILGVFTDDWGAEYLEILLLDQNVDERALMPKYFVAEMASAFERAAGQKAKEGLYGQAAALFIKSGRLRESSGLADWKRMYARARNEYFEMFGAGKLYGEKALQIIREVEQMMQPHWDEEGPFPSD